MPFYRYKQDATPIFRRWRCPDCTQMFKWKTSDELPDRCPLCNSWLLADEPPQEIWVPEAPAIRKGDYAKSWDQTANAMVAASEQRAEDAADQLRDAYAKAEKLDPHQGNPELLAHLQKGELDELKSGLKLTNMKEPNEMREGDSAVIGGPASAAANRLTMGASRPGFQNLGGGMPAAPGIAPQRVGAPVHGQLNGHQGWVDGTPASANPVHQQRAAAMTAAGQLGAYKG